MNKKEKLFSQFPPVSTSDWMARINADLKAADFNRKLVWKTREGFDVLPFYREDDMKDLKYIDAIPGNYPYIRGNKVSGNSWKIRQSIIVTDFREANRKALEILMKGVDSLGFVIFDPESVSVRNIEYLLDGIEPEAAELNFLSNGRAKELASYFTGWIAKNGYDPGKITGAIEADPLGRLALNGTLCIPVEKGLDYLAEVAGSLSSLPLFRAIHINASGYNNSGGNAVQEVAFGLSMGTEYISQLTERGLGAAAAFSKIRFSFAAGPEYFLQIAKLRAARLLWSVIAEGFLPGNTEAAKMDIHCVTGRWNKTLFDPYVNMLRTQTEAMSAILGGTDSLTVEPYDTVFRDPSGFSERIARNQQVILKEESYFDKVADPGAGSYYIEKLTDLLACSAWKLFLETEEKGGFLTALKSGFIGDKIEEANNNRKTEVASRRSVFVGTSRFPDPCERSAPDLDTEKLFRGEPGIKDQVLKPVIMNRGAEAFEKLRLDVERAPGRPSVFLFPIGNHAMRKARALFSSEFFGCAGYHIIDNTGFETVEQGVRKALESKPGIVVICSSDDEYGKYAPEIFNSLRSFSLIVVAGNPPCTEELKSLGIEYFISLKSDILSALSTFNCRLGIISNLSVAEDETRIYI